MANLDKDFTREEADEQYTDLNREEGGGGSSTTTNNTPKKHKVNLYGYLGAVVFLVICALLYLLSK